MKRAALLGSPGFRCVSVVFSFRSSLLFEGCPRAFMALAKNEDQNSDFDNQKSDKHANILFLTCMGILTHLIFAVY
jgi:hypothetical protein